MQTVKKYFPADRYYDLALGKVDLPWDNDRPVVGKYSYGPLCVNPSVARIGAFCSFAAGTNVAVNLVLHDVSTHQFLAGDGTDHSEYSGYDWYFPGVKPHGIAEKSNKVIIGNDVWLGMNVLITNGRKIGNGVIAGAGAVITKDVPDYAVVVGVPAKIIKYRFSSEQIESLNRIKWWDWDDNKIRLNFEDFYLPIEEFIEKHDR